MRGPRIFELGKWCPGADSNHRHADFQSAALPTELPGHLCGREWGRFDNRTRTRQQSLFPDNCCATRLI